MFRLFIVLFYVTKYWFNAVVWCSLNEFPQTSQASSSSSSLSNETSTIQRNTTKPFNLVLQNLVSDIVHTNSTFFTTTTTTSSNKDPEQVDKVPRSKSQESSHNVDYHPKGPLASFLNYYLNQDRHHIQHSSVSERAATAAAEYLSSLSESKKDAHTIKPIEAVSAILNLYRPTVDRKSSLSAILGGRTQPDDDDDGGGLSNTDSFFGKPKSIKQSFCDASASYHITSGDSLRYYLDDLECIFARGVAPLRPPLGLWYGDVLLVFKTERFNDAVRSVWSGKLGIRSQCRGTNTQFYLVLNFFANNFNMPAYMFVGSLKDPLASTEFDDGKNSLFVDYTPNMATVCPMEHGENHTINLGIVNDVFPINQLVDLVRIVGKTSDGGYILLGKTLARDPLNFPHVGDRTVAWWYVVNYDETAYPTDFVQSLSPMEKSFSYYHIGMQDFLQQAIKSAELFSNPLRASFVITDYLFRKPLGLPMFTDEARVASFAYPMAGALTHRKQLGDDQQPIIDLGTQKDNGFALNPINYSKIPGPYMFSGRMPGLTGTKQSTIRTVVN